MDSPTPANETPGKLSPMGYARSRRARGLPGGTEMAVRKAISSGRLLDSLSADGWIADVAAADLEWSQRTKPGRRDPPVPLPPSAPIPARPEALTPTVEPIPDGPPAHIRLLESRAKREAALAELAAIEV